MILLMGVFVTSILFSQASTDLYNLAQANNKVSMKLYKSLPSTGNAFYSPASIFVALGMLYKGASGNTAQEMLTALSYDTAQLRDESVHQTFKGLLDLFKNSSHKYKLDIANAVVASSGYPISEDYKKDLNTYYKAITKEVDFKSGKKSALNHINNWISEKTQGKIAKLADDLDHDKVMVLLNAVYFKGIWKTPFDENFTSDGAFYAYGKDVNRVKMMNVLGRFEYESFPEDNFHALKLSYCGGASMVIFLPFEKDGLKDLEEILTLQKLLEIAESIDGRQRKVNVSIPKFKLEHSIRLVEYLKQLGMRDAFTNGTADFSVIDENRRIFISDVVHKALIEVDEEINKVAAANEGGICVKSWDLRHQIEFKADHPFFFFIQNEKTDMILFMGRVNEL